MVKYLAMALAAIGVMGAGLGASVAAGGDHPGGPPEFVTICHAAGLAGTTKFVTLTIPYNAAYGQAGHFGENGTPNAGHEQDYEGACEGDETTPTDTTPTTPTETTPTTPTTTTPTTTTPTTPSPPTGAASVICDRGSFVYRVSGTIDGQAADSVSPSTIPGSTSGVTNVTVTRGDTSFRTSVTTNGDCAPPKDGGTSTTATTTAPATTTPTTTTPAANSPQPTTPPKAATPNAATPKAPKAATPKLTGNPKKDNCKPKNGLLECKTPTGTVTVVPGQG